MAENEFLCGLFALPKSTKLPGFKDLKSRLKIIKWIYENTSIMEIWEFIKEEE